VAALTPDAPHYAHRSEPEQSGFTHAAGISTFHGGLSRVRLRRPPVALLYANRETQDALDFLCVRRSADNAHP
jgi:hypothetical protein